MLLVWFHGICQDQRNLCLHIHYYLQNTGWSIALKPSGKPNILSLSTKEMINSICSFTTGSNAFNLAYNFLRANSLIFLPYLRLLHRMGEYLHLQPYLLHIVHFTDCTYQIYSSLWKLYYLLELYPVQLRNGVLRTVLH